LAPFGFLTGWVLREKEKISRTGFWGKKKKKKKKKKLGGGLLGFFWGCFLFKPKGFRIKRLKAFVFFFPFLGF